MRLNTLSVTTFLIEHHSISWYKSKEKSIYCTVRALYGQYRLYGQGATGDPIVRVCARIHRKCLRQNAAKVFGKMPQMSSARIENGCESSIMMYIYFFLRGEWSK